MSVKGLPKLFKLLMNAGANIILPLLIGQIWELVHTNAT